MTNIEKRRVAVLQKRMDHLARRIAQTEEPGRPLTFDRAEVAALDWALDIIGQHFRESVRKRAAK